MPASDAARMSEVPAGTVTGMPSISSEMAWPLGRGGVPRSIMASSILGFIVMALAFQTRIISLGSRGARRLPVKIFREMLQSAHYRHGGQPPKGAKRTIPQSLTQVLNQVDILHDLLALHDLVHGFGPAHGTDPAGGAFAAGFDGAELEGEAGLLGQVHGIVEYDDAAVPDHAAFGGESLVIQRHIEQAFRPIGAQRPPDLDRANGSARIGAAAEIVDQLAQGQSERPLDQAALFDVAGKL